MPSQFSWTVAEEEASKQRHAWAMKREARFTAPPVMDIAAEDIVVDTVPCTLATDLVVPEVDNRRNEFIPVHNLHRL